MENAKPAANSPRFLQDPPRYLSIFTRLSFAFSGWNCQLGWLLSGLTLAGLWYGLNNSELRYAFTANESWQLVPGELLAVESAGGKLSRTKIYQYDFSFDYEGQKYQGRSFSEEKQRHKSFPQPVQIEVLVGHPQRARIQAMRAERFDTRMGILMLFGALIPLGLMSLTWLEHRRNLRSLYLYRYGQFTRGLLHQKTELGLTVQKKRVYRYEFHFQDLQGQTHSAFCKTAEGESIEDEIQEIILYNPQDPEEHIIFDEIATGLEINEQGQLNQADWTYAFYLLLPPTILAGLGYWVLVSVG